MNETRAVFSSVEHMLHRRIMMYAFDFCYSLLEQFEYFFWGGGGDEQMDYLLCFFQNSVDYYAAKGEWA